MDQSKNIYYHIAILARNQKKLVLIINFKWVVKLKKHVKICTCYFFDGMIDIKNLDPNEIKINEKSYKNIFIYNNGYGTIKNYGKINSVNPLYLIISKINGYIEESNRNKYLTLVLTDETKDALKKYEKLQN